MTTHHVRRRTLATADAEAFDRDLAGLRPSGQGLALDLGAVEYLCCMALTRFVRLDRELKAGRGRLTLVNVRPAVREVFAVTRLDTVFRVEVA